MKAHAEQISRSIDAMLSGAVMLLRAGFYVVFAMLADDFEFARALLAGIVVGDLAASAFAFAWKECEHAALMFAELALLGIAFLWIRSRVPWPTETPDQALLFLAAFGVFVARAGRNALTRLGPSESDFA